MKTIRIALIALTLITGGVLAADNPPATISSTRPVPAAPPCMQNTNSTTPCGQGQGMPQSMHPNTGPGMQGGMAGNPSSMGPGTHGDMTGHPSTMGPGMQGGMMGNPSSMGPGMCGMMDNASGPPSSDKHNEQFFGWQMMTPAECHAYRAKILAAKTPEERAQIQSEHHKEMLERAKQRGITLPTTPPGSN